MNYKITFTCPMNSSNSIPSLQICTTIINADSYSDAKEKCNDIFNDNVYIIYIKKQKGDNK